MDIEASVKVAQALTGPIEKLIDTVGMGIGKMSDGVGKLYEPIHINRIAKTMRKNVDIPMLYDKNGVLIDTRDFQEIYKRTVSRMEFQELRKQQNIENVIKESYKELKDVECVSDEPVDSDWVSRFFNSVENIGNEEIQKIWGRMLAGEIKSPNTYSFRTMEILKNMTTKEIELFQKLASICISINNDYLISSNVEILGKFGLIFSDLILLEECGLLSIQELSINPIITENKEIFLSQGRYQSFISLKKIGVRKLTYNVFRLSKSACQLVDILSIEKNNEYFFEVIRNIIGLNQGINIEVFEPIIIENNNIKYEKVNI